jgi:hypothetical protein
MNYRHDKSGNVYTVVDFALLKVDGEWVDCVIYKNYGDDFFVRKKTDFDQKFSKV